MWTSEPKILVLGPLRHFYQNEKVLRGVVGIFMVAVMPGVCSEGSDNSTRRTPCSRTALKHHRQLGLAPAILNTRGQQDVPGEKAGKKSWKFDSEFLIPFHLHSFCVCVTDVRSMILSMFPAAPPGHQQYKYEPGRWWDQYSSSCVFFASGESRAFMLEAQSRLPEAFVIFRGTIPCKLPQKHFLRVDVGRAGDVFSSSVSATGWRVSCTSWAGAALWSPCYSQPTGRGWVFLHLGWGNLSVLAHGFLWAARAAEWLSPCVSPQLFFC